MKIKEFGDLKITYRKRTSDKEVLKQSLKNDVFFRGVPEYNLKPDDIIIDIGALIGTFSILAASKLEKGKVYAIEASKENFQYLEKNVILKIDLL